MLCTSAYNAAQAGDGDRALDLIADAAQAARHLPAPRPGQHATISQPQVTLYKVGILWSLCDPAAAVTAGRALRPSQFPTAERRARLHTDMARAWWQHGSPGHAASSLLEAARYAPAEIRTRPSIRSLAEDIIRHYPRAAGSHELAMIINVPPG